MAPARIKALLPSWAEPWLDALLAPWVLVLVSLVSLAFFALSLLGVPWFARHIPSDYLLTHEPRPKATGITLLGRVGRNLLGALLLLAGLLMLALPGQGILTLLIALSLIDFPGKHRLQRRILRERHVLAALNRMRAKSGHPPLRTERD